MEDRDIVENSKKNNKKINISLIIIPIIIVLLAVAGITYAFFAEDFKGERTTSIKAGKNLTFKYNETSEGLVSVSEMSDSEGINQDNYFDFDVVLTSEEQIGIAYTIFLTKTEGSLPDEAIKLYLTNQEDTQILAPTKISNLSNYTGVSNSKIIYKNTISGTGTVTHNYRLRAWIDENYEGTSTSTNQTNIEDGTNIRVEGQTYQFKVNVKAESNNVAPEVSEIVIEKEDSVVLNNTDTNSNVMRLQNSKLVANWVEATSIAPGDNIRFRVIYTKTIMGTAPTLGFKIGDSENNLTKGTISNNEIIYTYTVKDSESGTITITGLTGGNITDELGNASTNVITHVEIPSIEVEEGPFVPTEGTLAYEILGANNSNVVTSGDGLYMSTETNDGRLTYYYKGDVSNNCVSFANQTWRIVRINEDGTIRIMMQWGINNNTTYAFKPSPCNEYKYMYYSESNVTNGAKKTLTDWYTTNLSSYDSLIATSTYCEAAKVKGYSSYTSKNAEMIVYTDYTSNFRCPEDDGNGYGLITDQKIGLITIDEYLHASGGTYLSNENHIENGYNFWTMSPAGFNSNYTYAWVVNGVTSANGYNVDGRYSFVLRPVINLNADILTTQTPFVECPVDKTSSSGSGGVTD